MIPLKDNIPSRTTPFVSYTILAACSVVFLLQLATQGDPQVNLVERFGMVPARVFHPDKEILIQEAVLRGDEVVLRPRAIADTPVNNWLTLLTCIFLHGGWMHFLGNMWFLWIFGDNVEDRLGHLWFLVFYLGCGAAASASHLLVSPGSGLPTIGASGAIAGVMGAYFFLYPHAKVLSLVPLFFIMQIVVLPAPFFLGIWFLLQFFQGALSISDTRTGGVAWWAHIGGFVAGLVVAAVLRSVGQTRPPVEQYRRGTEHVGAYRRRGW